VREADVIGHQKLHSRHDQGGPHPGPALTGRRVPPGTRPPSRSG
jgi:hypothetical protein